MNSFSERIKGLRQKLDWTQEDLAKKMGVSRSTIAGYEAKSKLREPDFETVQRFASLFNVSVDYLLGRTDSRTTKQHGKMDIFDKDTTPTDMELEDFLKSSNVYFSGAPLTDEDKDDIMAYLRFKWEREQEKKKKN